MLVLLASFAASGNVQALQFTHPPDSLRLADLQELAIEQDPRAIQPEILESIRMLRIQALRATRLPQFGVSGQATYQTDVPSLPVSSSTGPAGPPKEQFRVQAETDWAFYDGGRTRAKIAVEDARHKEQLAGVRASLYNTKQATLDAFFSSLLLQTRASMLSGAQADLEARLSFLRRQANEGAALSTDADILEAELISVRQQAIKADSDRRAAVAILSALTGKSIAEDVVLALPQSRMAPAALGAVAGLDPDLLAMIQRPEVDRMQLQADRLHAESRATRKETRPQASLFVQAGVGQPNPYNFLTDEIQEYAILGLKLRWTLFDSGRSRRTSSALRQQASIVESEATAINQQIVRSLASDLADLSRLDNAIADDSLAVTLRENVVQVARLQLENGVSVSSAYTDKLNDLTTARLTLAQRKIEQAYANARVLLAVGIDSH